MLAARAPALPTCVTVDDEVRCDPAGARPDGDNAVLDRLVAVRDAVSGDLSLTGLVRSGPSAAALFDPVGSGIRARASSWLGSDVQVRPSAAVDGDPTTSWVADLYDARPQLDLTWSEPRVVTSVSLGPSASGQHFADPLEVSVVVGGRTVSGLVGPGGTLPLPPTRAKALRLTVTRTSPVASVDGTSGLVTPAPVSISEVEVGGLADLVYSPDLSSTTGAICGLGPTLELDGVVVRTSVRSTLGDVLAGSEVAIEPCGRSGATLTAGTHRVVVRGTQLVAPLTFAILSFGQEPAPATRDVAVTEWSSSDRTVTIGAGGQALLRVAESANPGWSAELDGVVLTPLRVDGWQQGWLVPAGAGGSVHLRYAPSSAQVVGLSVGAGAALLALVLGLIVRGRPGTWSSRPARGLPPWATGAVVVGAGATTLGFIGALAGLVALALARRRAASAVAFIVTAGAAVGVVLAWSALLLSALCAAGALVAVASAVSRRRDG